ncbi:A disintegrin and metalloproteinase with thrombospondin motifs 16-like [Lepus europaeus]|uniref:A disintegrin and metalloproteinase with thrombospondin motifs 16-like n=1 Tax=Lepus europaeus TaxID=9983 RepID=UPI002B4677A8|nr:A disintegrin and metalloproteinase with thrombospondin motifs 16-like [Lepus europaeus]
MRSRGCAALWVLLLAQVGVQAPACALGPAAAAPGNPSVPHPAPPSEPRGWAEEGEYDLVSAYEVDHTGDYVSHEVTHGQRRRRAVPPGGGDSLHLRLKGFGHDFHLDLRASSNLVAPGFIVQTFGKGGTKSVQSFSPEDFCFYQGSLRSHRNSSVALSTCHGLVSALFKDGTIGGNINIAIVGLILLEDEQPGLVISHHADHTLSSFCQWQSGLMGKDGTRHDHAILLTGLDICSWKNEPCDTLGFAPISGMCSKYRSCTINEDTGLGLAFTIAHESGHNFGMVHDGEGNVCKKSEGNIMSPTLAGRNGVFSWSPCSRQYLHKFLSTAQAVCLADQPKPVKEYKYPEKLPGELYDANTQCKWQFGEKAKLCMLDFKKHPNQDMAPSIKPGSTHFHASACPPQTEATISAFLSS